MKKGRNLAVVVVTGALLLVAAPAQAQRYQVRELEDVRVVVPVKLEKGRRYPAMVFLPYTGGTPTSAFSNYLARAYSRSRLAENLILILPDSDETDDGDYDDHEDWAETVEDWDIIVEAALAQTLARYPVDEKRIFVGGYSMGGDLSWALALRRPQRYAGALVMGSRCSWRAPASMKALAKLQRRFTFLMGSKESPSRVQGMEKAVRLLERKGIPTRYRRYPAGHRPPPGSGMVVVMEELLLPQWLPLAPAVPVKPLPKQSGPRPTKS
ncbi:MAG: alpha/beta hydrolase-fold protein [Nevskiales bacterium]